MITRSPSPFRTVAFARRETSASANTEPAHRWSREWVYFTFVTISWCFTPLVRRLLDWRAGAFNPVQVTSLIPLLALLPLVFVALKKERVARWAPTFKWLAGLWVATFAYGFTIAAATGSISAALFECIQYLVPMLAGLWLAGQDLSLDDMLRRLRSIVLPCAGCVAIYGLFQWVQPMPWDVLWVEGADFTSAGDPVPFAMRVFATLNSPGPAADFFVLTILLSLPLLRLRSAWMWPLLGSLVAALLLTLVREAWIALLVGTCCYLMFSPRRLTTLPSIVVGAFLVVFMAVSLPAMLGSGQNADIITSRISTFGDVSHDESALTRQDEISESLVTVLNNPLGSGLGNVGAGARLGSNPQSMLGNVLDSGYLARLVELGWLGFLGYAGVTIGGPIAIGIALFRKGVSANAKVVGSTAIAICVALAWSDASGDAHFGVEGFFFWIALALGSFAIRAERVAERPQRRAMRLSAR